MGSTSYHRQAVEKERGKNDSQKIYNNVSVFCSHPSVFTHIYSSCKSLHHYSFPRITNMNTWRLPVYNVCFSESCLFSLPSSGLFMYLFLLPFILYSQRESLPLLPSFSTIEWTINTHYFRTKNGTTFPGTTEETFQFFLFFLLLNTTFSTEIDKTGENYTAEVKLDRILH